MHDLALSCETYIPCEQDYIIIDHIFQLILVLLYVPLNVPPMDRSVIRVYNHVLIYRT